MTDSATHLSTKLEYKNLHLRIAAALTFLMAGLLLLAGRLDYWQGWVFVAYCSIVVACAMPLFNDKIDILKERTLPKTNVKIWAIITHTAFMATVADALIVAALDTGRFSSHKEFPAMMYAAGYILLAVGQALVIWAVSSNQFFLNDVCIRPAEGHYVVREGPYAYIRHPGYLGAVFCITGSALALGSFFSLIPVAVAVLMLVIRTCLEDNVLRAELDGYSEYTADVPSKFLPLLW